MKPGYEKPVNATAARVVARGESFEYRQMVSEVCSSTPLQVTDDLGPLEDMRGAKFGRLTVIGKSAETKRRWVCRCVCGNYVHRRTNAIRAAAEDACCPQCYLMAVSKRNEFLARTGKERHTKEFM